MPVFTANIPGTLKVGDRIEIGGKIKENARKMSVNLCAQEGEEPRDVVLHFDVRFHRDNIISLSRKNGIWIGSGNYDTNYNMFVPGTIFRIIFEIKDTDVITIYCQGKFHSNFLPKIPLTMARFIVAWADVERITHCYFHFSNKALGDEAVGGAPGAYQPQSPRPTMVAGDIKRCQRLHKKSVPGSPQLHSSNESSDEDQKPRTKADGRADRYFYETLMCQQADHPKFGSPESMKRRDPSLARSKIEYRKYREVSDTEKDSEDYSEDMPSKHMDSSLVESDDVLQELGLKKRNRRGKFAPFAQVVNFMGKTTRRN
ncbi:uncharacterized protein LOC110384645 [Helicoverpa armigera]|uniref:uncharacterized protein LOC124643203 n=1 Tax=Helicoverpa zea TaxID=7113 RepID=UPI000B397E11|nr:uncharacterized protein LOC110384645 [Helicoverpa armigera]XP_047038039.1 uncharacterized protein LOC124643203 [Helicoverpa zea]PZC84860.1 hypothetical protein B5X24_HaOG203850 [Helicoverpa armigera]